MSNIKMKKKGNQNVDQLSNLDYVTTNATSSQCEAQLYIFSNKGTGGMECSVVLFKPRIHLFACTHPSVSNSLDCNSWLAYKHVCVRTSVYSPLFQTRLDYGSVSGYKHLPPASVIKLVWNLVPVVYKHQSPPVSQTHLD